MKIGTAKYKGAKKTFKIKDGDNIYGILPPLGKLAEVGKWSQYYKIEWGYKNSQGRYKPFQDVRKINPKTKMVEVESAAHLKREALIARKNELITLLKQGKATKDQVQNASDLVRDFNLDCKHYINVITPEGEIGLLKIGHRAKLALDSAIKALRGQGVEPIGMKGVFFNLNRYVPMGKPLDTTYTITPYTENVQANVDGQMQIIQRRKHYELTEVIIGRLPNEAYELSGMYPVLTPEQVEKIVNGNPFDVDEVFGDTSSPIVDEDNMDSYEEPLAKGISFNIPQAAPQVAPQATANVAPQATAPATQATKEVVTEEVESELSDEEWLKSIGAV